jgi:deoxyribonuclease-1
MDAAYPRYSMGGPTEKLMDAWDRMYPPDAWECARARRIAKIQGNINQITESRCKEVGL